jgi:2-methylcitrate synthase
MPGPKKSVALSGVSVAETSICSIDPDAGALMYRGYDIADLVEQSSYEEVAYLLLEGDLPSGDELETFEEQLAEERSLPPTDPAERRVRGRGAAPISRTAAPLRYGQS